MTTKMAAVKDLQSGDTLSDTVLSFKGKVLLGKDVVLTEKHISLLISWDVQSVFIYSDEEDAALDITEATVAAVADSQPFNQEYQTLVTDTNQIFDIIKKRQRIPVVSLQNTAATIHSFITANGSPAINYLLAGNYKITDFITQHSIMVAFFAGIIAQRLKWSEDDIKGVTIAGLLHDAGSLITGHTDGVTDPPHIAETAALLKKSTGLSNDIILGIVQHREYIDGTGFPTRANGTSIHPYAKVIAVCDTFHNQFFNSNDANPFPALQMIASEMFGKLDPSICHTFVSRIRDSLLHHKILLSDGQEAEILFFHPNGSPLPIVRTNNDQVIDLAKHSKTIQRIVISDTSSALSQIAN